MVYQIPRPDRERGTILVVATFAVMMIFAVTGVVLNFSVREAKASTDRMESTGAFYLAEAAIEAAKWEFNELQDPGSNGYGTTDWTYGNKSYSVTATDLGDENYLLSANGTVGGQRIDLEVVLGRELNTNFPEGALSIVGEIDKLRFDLKREENLILDGAGTPALRFSDQDAYDAIGQQLADALDDLSLPAANLTGFPESDFGGTMVPIVQDPSYASELTDFELLYNKLVDKVDQLRVSPDFLVPAAGNLKMAYGDADNPVTVYIPDLKTLNSKCTGYGTLIIGHSFTVNNNAKLDWHGDIFVVGDTSKNAALTIDNGSSLTVDGTLTILGEGINDGTGSSKFKIKKDAAVVIDGSLFVGSDWTAQKKTTAEFRIDNDGSFTLNGIMSLIGPKVKVDVRDKDEEGNPETNGLNITGMMQVALPTMETVETEFQLKIWGNLEIHRDVEEIHSGIVALEKMGIAMDVLPQVMQVYTRNVSVQSWRKVPSGGGGG